MTLNDSNFRDVSANFLEDAASLRNIDVKYEVTSRRGRDTISERGAFHVRSRSCIGSDRSQTALSDTSNKKAIKRINPSKLARHLAASNLTTA